MAQNWVKTRGCRWSVVISAEVSAVASSHRVVWRVLGEAMIMTGSGSISCPAYNEPSHSKVPISNSTRCRAPYPSPDGAIYLRTRARGLLQGGQVRSTEVIL